ncbi:MAG: TetR family transcriptional regulator [Clostridia bacterium]|nr:TetR family transcriptional regulator [Clostridia bacterium]
MGGQHETRMRIVDGTMSLLSKCDVDKIKVVSICEASGVSRATFYRYFYDVIDVAYWLWDELNAKSLYRMGNPLGWHEAHIRQFQLVSEYRLFFERSFSTRDYISVSVYGGRKIRTALLENINEVKGYKMTERERFEFEYYVCGCTYMFAKWVQAGMNELPEEMADLFGRFIPPFLKELCGK